MFALLRMFTSDRTHPPRGRAVLGALQRTAFEMYRRDRFLTAVAALLLMSAIVMTVFALFDTRMVMGLNPWIKPAKFAASFAIYFLTLGWLLHHLPGPTRSVRIIRWLSAAGLLLEMPVLVGQAARGVISHFNTTTMFDFALSALMGIGAFTQMGMLAWALVLFCTRPVALPRLYLDGVRAGMALLLLGVAPAIAMLILNRHNVGVSDGGAGLPLLNWSTVGGDLRIAHFLGLHALQAIPFAGFLLSRKTGNEVQSRAIFAALAGIYALAMCHTFLQALAGEPLIGS